MTNAFGHTALAVTPRSCGGSPSRSSRSSSWRRSCAAAAALPVVAVLARAHRVDHIQSMLGRAALFSVLIVPSYIAFALCLMVERRRWPTWVTGARTPANAEMRIADMGWPLMRWARYMVASHLVRVLAGGLFRGSPDLDRLSPSQRRADRPRRVHELPVRQRSQPARDRRRCRHRQRGAHVWPYRRGRRREDGARCASDATSRLGLARSSTSVSPSGHGCQVGALSLVPKYTTLEADAVYAGIPVRRIDRPSAVV